MTTMSYRHEGTPGTVPEGCRAAGYVRQDFGEMGKKWTRPDSQKARISSCAEAHGWELACLYEDIGWTGECLNRPGLVSLLGNLDFQVLIVDRTDRLACRKEDLDFLLALLEERGVTCVPATWSWEPLSQYMRWWYRSRGNPVYAQLDGEPAKVK
ncbi:MAG: recombinase family protein [Dehalococcoidia bacterium]|nr:recombinase family protein [Dehalococcoidia bacterium]